MRKRSAYRPKVVMLNTMERATWHASMVSEQGRTDILAEIEDAYIVLREGRLHKDTWNCLANGMNIAEALASDGIGPNLLPEIMRAHYALRQIARRIAETGSSTVYGLELALVREGIDMLNAQLQQTTNGELRKACDKATAALRT